MVPWGGLTGWTFWGDPLVLCADVVLWDFLLVWSSVIVCLGGPLVFSAGVVLWCCLLGWSSSLVCLSGPLVLSAGMVL